MTQFETHSQEFWCNLPRDMKLHTISQTRLITESLLEITGREIIPGARHMGQVELAEALYEGDFVLLSHDGRSDPILNYANGQAQKLWQMPLCKLMGLPSRLTAEPDEREKRADFLKRANEQGYVNDYEGVRISAMGNRFRIENVLIWRLKRTKGLQGLAAMFHSYTPL